MDYKRIKFLMVFALGGVSAFSQTIQYKNELTEDWQTLDASNIEAKCLSKARALKLSGDFSSFKVSLKKSNGQYGTYETGLVINACLNDYPDNILANYYGYSNSCLQEVDMSEVTGVNSLQCFALGCVSLAKIDFPVSTITNQISLNGAFWRCSSLQKADLTMFTNLKDIMQSFVDCYNLTDVRFNNNPERTELNSLYCAFYGCEKLKTIDLSMFSIKDEKNCFDRVFYGCLSLNYVYLPTNFVVYGNRHYADSFIEQNFEESNPNCLKILTTDEKVPENMDKWTNIIYNGKAYTDISLFEGSKESSATNIVYNYTFECPMPFELGDKVATFTPVVSTYGNGIGGWSTLTIPFTGALQVKSETDDDYKSVYPATNSFDGYYWLREYKDGKGKAVNFGVVNNVNRVTGEALQANIPYIIAFPGSKFGDDNMEGKQIRFIATSGAIPMTTDLKVNGRSGSYAFQGNLNGSSASGTAYKLVSQEDGRDYFEETTDANLPFHAQIISTEETVSHAKRLSIYADGETTGIVGVADVTSQQPSTYFTIDGVDTGVTDAKLLKKGIYIHGNKKIVIG